MLTELVQQLRELLLSLWHFLFRDEFIPFEDEVEPVSHSGIWT